jgi:hypothetical protein
MNYELINYFLNHIENPKIKMDIILEFPLFLGERSAIEML